MTKDEVKRLGEVIAFLDGQDSLDGFWFSDAPPPDKGRFWWRKRMRDDYAALLSRCEAAEAERDLLKDKLGLQEALTEGAHRRARAAEAAYARGREDALREAAEIAFGEEVKRRILALIEKPEGE